MRRILLWPAFVVLTLAIRVSAAVPGPMELADRHAATLSSIRTLRAEFEEVTAEDETMATGTRGKVVRQGDHLLIVFGMGDKWRSTLSLGAGEQRIVARRPNAQGGWAYDVERRADNSSLVEGDPFGFLLLSQFVGPGRVRMSLGELVKACDPPETTTATLDGREVVRLTARFTLPGDESPTVTRLWLDPARGFLAVRRELYVEQNPEFKAVTEITAWERHAGVELPIARSLYRQKRGERGPTQTYRLSKVVVNGPVEERDLRMPSFPSGTRCLDRRNNTTYPVGSDWAAVGPAVPHQEYGVTVTAPPAEAEGHGNKASESEATDPTGWVLLGVAVVLILAAVLLVIYRRFRSRSS